MALTTSRECSGNLGRCFGLQDVWRQLLVFRTRETTGSAVCRAVLSIKPRPVSCPTSKCPPGNVWGEEPEYNAPSPYPNSVWHTNAKHSVPIFHKHSVFHYPCNWRETGVLQSFTKRGAPFLKTASLMSRHAHFCISNNSTYLTEVCISIWLTFSVIPRVHVRNLPLTFSCLLGPSRPRMS